MAPARRIARGFVCAFALYLCLAAAAPAADKSKDAGLPVKLFVDVTSTRLADEVKSSDKKKFNLGGVPVVLGALRQDGGALPSIAAGVSGNYDVKLGDLGVKANGYLARVHTEGFDLLSDARYLWRAERNFVQLDPHEMPAHVFRVRRKTRSERDFDYFL